MRVLVTGGTGFVGGNVVRELVDRGHEPICIVRPGSEGAARVRELGAQVVHGDVIQPESLSDLPSAHALINLAGIIYERGENTFEHVHADAPKNIVDVANRCGAKKIVHMSALGTRPGAASRYHQTKWEGENSIRMAKIPWTIFRPSVIFGMEAWGRPGEIVRQMLSLHGKIIWAFTPVIGSGQSKIRPVWVGDVARFFVDAVDNLHTDSRTLDLGGPTECTFLEFQDALCRARFGKVKWHLHMPLWVARITAWKMEKLPGVAWITKNIFRMPIFTRDQVKMIPEDNTCDMDPALALCPIQLTGLESWAEANLKR